MRLREGNQKRIDRIYLVFAFALPIVLMLGVMAFTRIWPMGDKSLLLWDMEIQYVNIYNWYHDVLHGNASIFYDFSKSLGGNMYGVFATYLASPINLAVYFFSPEKILYFLSLSTLFKIGLAGLFCQIYLKRRFPEVPGVLSLLMASSYALMEYNVGLSSNLHFLDPLYMLPLMALGVYLFLREGKSALLCLSIGYTVFCNWYIGAMACLGVGVYFLFELFLLDCGGKEKGALAVRFIPRALIGGLLGSGALFPAVISTLGGKGDVSLSLLYPRFHCDFWEPMKALLLTARANHTYTEPAIYVGGFVPVLCLLGLLHPKVDKRSKRCVLLLLLSVYLSFSYVPLEAVWTMLSRTYSFYFRYSFLFSFFLVVSAALLYTEMRETGSASWRAPIQAVCILAGFALYAIARDFIPIRNNGIYFVLLALYVLLLSHFVRGKEVRRWEQAAIAILLMADLGANAYLEFKRYTIPNEDYINYVEEVGGEIDELLSADESFYRMEKTFSEMDNRRGRTRPVATEALTFNYNAITHYSSLIDERVNTFLVNTGYIKAGANASNYVNTNPLMDSLLGVKYLLTNDETALLRELGSFSANVDDSLFVYQNEYALGLATRVCGFEVDQWKDDPFLNQLAVLHAMTGGNEAVYLPQSYEEIGPGEWNAVVERDGPLYLYFPVTHDNRELWVNGEYIENYFVRFYKNIVFLGEYHKGDVVSVVLAGDGACTQEHQLLLYTVDEALFAETLNRLQQLSLQPVSMTDTRVVFQLDGAEEQNVWFSIPYDKGWSVQLDGKDIEPELAYDTFLALRVPAGEHTVQLRYSPPALGASFTITFISALALALLLRAEKKRNRGDRHD